MKLSDYHQDIEISDIGALPYRSAFVPLDKNGKEKRTLLSSDWKFRKYERIEQLELDSICEDKMDSIKVPSVWQSLGYDKPQYTNIPYPIPLDPPYVPYDNPVGLYIKHFEIKKKNERYILSFEGVDSAFHVYLNSVYIGFAKISHAVHEFDVTANVLEGDNTIAVIVFKWSDGTYLEDQDKFRYTGIFRDVYLIEREEKYIEDFHIKESFNDDFSICNLTLAHKGGYIEKAYLEDESGKMVAIFDKAGFATVENPTLWNAEKPYIYTLFIETRNEIIKKKIGLRKIYIKNGICFLNGKKIKLIGVNRHDSNPISGPVVSNEHIERDLNLIKSANFNCIRTSHYPSPQYLYDRALELGLYVISEADVECHGLTRLEGGTHQSNFNIFSYDERFRKQIGDRNKSNFAVHKNDSAVIMWSFGNESGMGPAFSVESVEAYKEDDGDRLLHYEGAMHAKVRGYDVDDKDLSVDSFMYDSPEYALSYIQDPENEKPFFWCEFLHAMGNGPGGAAEYADAIWNNDKILGGCIWEWCDHAVKTDDGYLYGGDWGEYPNDGNFCVDGMVGPDRELKPSYYEIAYAFCPVRAELVSIDKGDVTIRITNHLSFATLPDTFVCNYETVNIKGINENKGTVPLKGLKAGESKSIVLNLGAFEPDTHINLYFSPMEGKIIGSAVFALVKQELTIRQAKMTSEVREDEENFYVRTEKYEYVISKGRARIERIIEKETGKDVLLSPARIVAYRAPIDNDRKIKGRWKEIGFDRVMSNAYFAERKDDCLYFDIRLASPVCQPYFKGKLRISISNTDEISFSYSLDRTLAVPDCPRLGMEFAIGGSSHPFRYFGFGPDENYEDKLCSSHIGHFSGMSDNMFIHYIKPQESGSRCGVRHVEIGNMLFESDKPFSFNASPYSMENIESAGHDFKLIKEDKTYIIIDYRMSGVGTAACGPELPYKYRIREKHIDWNFKLTIE